MIIREYHGAPQEVLRPVKNCHEFFRAGPPVELTPHPGDLAHLQDSRVAGREGIRWQPHADESPAETSGGPEPHNFVILIPTASSQPFRQSCPADPTAEIRSRCPMSTL